MMNKKADTIKTANLMHKNSERKKSLLKKTRSRKIRQIRSITHEFGRNICEIYSLREIKDMVFDALMNTDTDSIYIKDCRGRFNIINQRVIHELGVNRLEEVIGKTDIDLFGREFGLKTEYEEQQLYRNGQPIADAIEWREDTPSIKYWTSTTKIPIKNREGEVIGLIGITRNISQLKVNEQNLQNMVCHDPLTGAYNRIGLIDRLGDLINQPNKPVGNPRHRSG